MITIYLAPGLSFEVTEAQAEQAVTNRLAYAEQLRDRIYASHRQGRSMLQALQEAID